MPPVFKNSILDRLQPKQDRRAIHSERRMTTEAPSSTSNLATTADPYASNTGHKVSLFSEPNIVIGRIAEIVEYGRTYRVKLERGAGMILCCDMIQTSCETMGARQLNSYVPGSMVIVVWHPHALYGIILGVIPDWMVAPQDAVSDYISQGSNVGLTVDQVQSFPLNLNDAGAVVDWSAGRPFDHIADGDWGAVTDTGAMVFLDPFMTFMRVDEETGLFFFYDNQRGRLTAHNLQVRSGAHEFEAFEDQSETNSWEGYTTGMYCERMGSFSEGSRYREYTPDDYQFISPWYTRYEPEDDEQQAIFRLRVFRGYFGQGDSRMLCIPPVGASGIQTYSDELKFPGVSEDQWDTDGQISIRSAKSLIIAKRAILPNPKQLKVPEDVTGDIANCTADNYRFRGKISCLPLPDHKVGDMTDAAFKPSLVRAAAFRDMYALKEIHKDMLGLRYHKTDWYVPNESDYPFSGQMIDGIRDYSVLCSQQWLDPADPILLHVDDRYNNNSPVKYWPSDSYLAMLEDGGLLLADGFGFELRTVDGSAIMSTPGDIWMLPGRSFHAWAGWDVSVRGNNCVDIAANNCDVRIKAENRCLIMGGNDKCGGVLIESKSPGIQFTCDADREIIGGVILRAKNSAVVTYAAQIELILSGEVAYPPAIVLQAHGQQIITESTNFIRFIEQSAQDVFISSGVDDCPPCTVCAVNEYWCDGALLCTPLRVNANVFVNGCLLVEDEVTVGGPLVGTDFQIIDDFSTLDQAATDTSDRCAYLMDWGVDAIALARELECDTDVAELEFYFRSTDQQKMSDLVLFETKWQQEARVIGMPVVAWTENPIVFNGCFTGITDYNYPPPGKAAWVTDSDWYNEDQTLYSLSTNLMTDWGPAYEYPTPTYQAPTNQPFDGNFLIIRNTCEDCV